MRQIPLDRLSEDDAARERWAGLDVMRIAAAGAVFAQHFAAVAGIAETPLGHSLRVGRYGTAAFYALAGFLAAASTRSADSWIRQRLQTIFPPYWIALAVSFLAAGMSSYKPFDTSQVICQLAGIGWFTHPENLVNVPTWFVSAILVLYLLSYLAKRTNETIVIMVALAGSMAMMLWGPSDASSAMRGATVFLLAYTLPLIKFPARITAVGWAAILAAGTWVWPELRFGVVAMLLLAGAMSWQGKCAAIRRIAAHSYPWFLVHGLALHAARRVVGTDVGLLLLTGLGLAIVAAVLLRQMTLALERQLATLRWQPVAPAAELSP